VSRRSNGAISYNELKALTPWEAEVVVAELNRLVKLENDAISGKTGKSIEIHGDPSE
jgi:hypothetical protein